MRRSLRSVLWSVVSRIVQEMFDVFVKYDSVGFSTKDLEFSGSWQEVL